MEGVNDSVPDYLKCPICYDIPQDKVFQCKNGHPFCETCFKKLPNKRCPQCRAILPKVPIRSRVAEEALDNLNLVLACPFQNAGCERNLNRKEIVEHRSSCKFDIEKFGNLRKVCSLFGFKNCSFAFNRANTEEAIAHFKSVHKMRSPKALLLDQFTLVYDYYEIIFNSKEAAVFTPLIFDQKWWGHNCIYIVVTRFNPLDKTLQFTPLSLIHEWDGMNFLKNLAPEPVEFSLGFSRGIVYPQNLLSIGEGQTLSDLNYFAAPIKNGISIENPGIFSSTLQIKLSKPSKNFQPPQDGQEKKTVYGFWDVLTPNLLDERWPTVTRQVCSVGVPQNWNEFEWISYMDYEACKNRFSPTSSYLEMNVLICRANINEEWLAGYIQIDHGMNLVTPAIFNAPNLLNAYQTFRLNENFEVLYLPQESFEWVKWTDLEDKKPIPVHDDRQDLLICECRRAPGVTFMGTIKKDTKHFEEASIYVLVTKFN